MFNKIFKNQKDNKGISVPIPDDAEATWSQVSNVPVTLPEKPWSEPEGELALDVYLTKDDVIVRTTIAGVRPEDINVAMHNDLLTIRGRRTDEAVEVGRQYIVQECHWGSFSRSVVLPVTVNPESAEAVMKNGVLTVTLKRTEPKMVKVREEEI